MKTSRPTTNLSDPTRKIMVITIHRRDYALLETMLANGREKLPDLEMDGLVSAIVAEACRFHSSHSGTTPAFARWMVET